MNEKLRFAGSDYEPSLDTKRLTNQLQRIFSLMRDNTWRTLAEIAEATQDPPASVSAQLRHLRKRRFGSHTVNKRIRGEREAGLYEYQLTINKTGDIPSALTFLDDVEFSRNRVTLKKYVSKENWSDIDKQLRKQNYHYIGKGIWEA